MSHQKKDSNILKAEEIAFVWKSTVKKSPECYFIKDTIVSIYNKIPNNSYYDPTRVRLYNILDSIWYSTPEILQKSWGDIYTTLITYIPFKHTNKISKWTNDIFIIWNKAQKQRIHQPSSSYHMYLSPPLPPPLPPLCEKKGNDCISCKKSII